MMRRPDPEIWILPTLVVAFVNGCNGREEPPGTGVNTSSSITAACPTGLVIEVELAAWKLSIEGMAHWTIDGVEPEGYPDIVPDYDTLLGELGLAPLPDRTMEELTWEQGVMGLEAVEITNLRRGGSEAPDRLVAVQFRNTAGAQSLRAQVLRPLPDTENSFCSVGDELSHDTESGEQPCIEKHSGFSRSLSVESLLAPDLDAIKVQDAGGWCGEGTHRGDRFSTAYWGVEDARLVRYFEAITAEAWYESPEPPVKLQRGRIEFSDTWPKTITITEVVECMYVGGDCTPSEQTRSYHYTDNHYVTVNKPALTE